MGKTKTYFLIVVLVTLLLPDHAIAQSRSLSLSVSDPAVVETMLTEKIKSKLKRGAYFLLGIDDKLQKSREELSLLQQNIRELEKKVNSTKTDVENLESQLSNLDQLITANQAKVRAIKMQIAYHQNAIMLLAEDIEEKQDEIIEHTQALDKTLTTYYAQTNLFFDNENSPALLTFLASEESIGDVLKQNEYLFFLQNASRDLAKQIVRTQEELDDKKNALEDKQNDLEQLETMLSLEEKTLRESQQSKERLLIDTKGKQAIYESLLELSKKEEEQVSAAIAQLKENYAFFESKLAQLQTSDGSSTAIEDPFFIEPNVSGQLNWPVSPSLGISAYFKDGAYQKALGIVHNAIDIRLTQGSKVKSADDGVVTKVSDNGFAYSYIIIAHANKMMTLYGHMSEMLVSEGQLVRKGQTIGLSGGIPGTKGAGWLTTGAHLHLEVFKNFQHVDPLEYLPLEYLPLNNLPDKYLERITDDIEKIRRSN